MKFFVKWKCCFVNKQDYQMFIFMNMQLKMIMKVFNIQKVINEQFFFFYCRIGLEVEFVE